MTTDDGLAAAAELFKVLGNQSRLRLLRLLEQSPRTVGALAEAAGLSQPLVSQHLRTLRHAGLVSVTRSGKESIYEVADHHVSHVIGDALEHVHEPDDSAH
ncbi:ArsR/SmtB family transcription factor [Microbacterium koreense]|uniref:ArsR/SmtB family transcription factor n=1 Tax=Microbacterium koreense TaxID=323761 RepID=A0ABW2ZPC8_9MICO